MARGRRWGQPKYGYRTIKSATKNALAPHVEEQRVLVVMQRLRRQGNNYRQIADELNRRRIPTRQAGARWHRNTVRRILSYGNEL